MASSSTSCDGTTAATHLLSLKKDLESSSKDVKKVLFEIIRKHSPNCIPSGSEVVFDIRELNTVCLSEIRKVLSENKIRDESGKPRHVEFTDLPPSVKPVRELEVYDSVSHLSPVQAAAYKKVKECAKNLIKHKRVYGDKDYGVDDGEDVDIDILPDDGGDVDGDGLDESQAEAEAEEVEQNPDDSERMVMTTTEDETQGDEDDDGDELEPHDEDTATRVPNEDEPYQEMDETTNVDVGTEGGNDIETLAPDEEAAHEVRLYFGDVASTAQRFLHYRTLLSETTEFSDCSELGIIGLND